MDMQTRQERCSKLARALKMTPLKTVWVQPSRVTGERRWWLVGCAEGDTPLPRTGGAHTIDEALDAAEAWLAPELEEP